MSSQDQVCTGNFQPLGYAPLLFKGLVRIRFAPVQGDHHHMDLLAQPANLLFQALEVEPGGVGLFWCPGLGLVVLGSEIGIESLQYLG